MFQTHSFSYHHQGKNWTLSIPATSEEDARERISILQNWGKYDGVVVASYPDYLGSWLPRLICWWKALRGGTERR
jgi:hypothetical protein